MELVAAIVLAALLSSREQASPTKCGKKIVGAC